MKFLLALLCVILGLSNTSYAKPVKKSQLKCAEELSSYKRANGKSELSVRKAHAVCKKNSSEKFLACVAGTKRHLEGLSEAIRFCKKDPSNSQQMCAQNLSAYKSKGERDISAERVAQLCQNKKASKVVDCIGLTQRSFGSTQLAVKFCEKNPDAQKQACVNELAAMKDRKSKRLAQGKRLGEICMQNSSVAFLDCVAKSRSTAACGVSKKSSTANRAVASNSSEDSIVLKSKYPKRLPKKVIRE